MTSGLFLESRMSKPNNKENSGDALSGIQKYLRQQNRPYSVTDILNNLHKTFGKTLVMKTLDTLVAQGSVKEKAYGKQKVYVINQDDVPTGDKAEMTSMDAEIDELTKSNSSLQQNVNDLTATHKSLLSNITLEEARTQLDTVNKECASLESKLNVLRHGQVLISKEEADKIKRDLTTKVGCWRKRKRMATEILDSILESYPKPKKSLYEDIGVETDEDCKVTLPK